MAADNTWMHHFFLPRGIEGVDTLLELALDLRLAGEHAVEALWRRIDADLWEASANPWMLLQAVSRERLSELLHDSGFRRDLDAAVARRDALVHGPTWFDQHAVRLESVAYFSLEFMLGERLPIYSGGLGNVAGDQLKAASDLGVPVVGVGLLYQQGYFRQVLDERGEQRALYPYNEPMQLSITPLRRANGEWLRVSVPAPGGQMHLRTWRVLVGRCQLLLLDSNDPTNPPSLRTVTAELYGGDSETRIAQEIALGIGGWRLLRALGATPDVLHLNEGHAAFAVLERARSVMDDTHRSFEVSLCAARAGTLFTTHTPVAAGFDRFDPSLVRRHLARYADDELGCGLDAVLALGRRPWDDAGAPLNMAHLAMSGAAAVTGVSALHEGVSRRMFAARFPRWPLVEVPIAHVTNGVHVPTWDSREASELWSGTLVPGAWRSGSGDEVTAVHDLPDEDLWELRSIQRSRLVEYARAAHRRDRIAAGLSTDDRPVRLDRDTLTIGFARRFAAYKRPDLLLHDPDRLVRLLTGARPVQLLVAGKAHPFDQFGAQTVRRWVELSRREDVEGRVVFLADYDQRLTRELVQGVDVWINTPRRPWEASGTSGMKVLANGGLNVSVLDGWWAEAFRPDVGWSVGDAVEHDESWDDHDADALYAVLEDEVVPAFYERDARGLPLGWLARMRASMASLTPRYAADRVVREYAEHHYFELAERYRRRAANGGELAAGLVALRRDLDRCWPEVRFDAVHAEVRDGAHHVRATVHLAGLDPSVVLVEWFAEPASPGAPPERHRLDGARLGADGGTIEFSGTVATTRPIDHYTARIVASHPELLVPLEASHITWADHARG
jgi:starch phosphorylase